MAPRVATRPELAAASVAGSIDVAAFAALIEVLAPFEKHPRVAVAVSGGADSLCLALLAHEWVRGRGGAITALIVDHGLRPESAEEANTVAGWLAARGIAAAVLRWDGAKPSTGIQDAARQARYRLMTAWCRAHGVLHLLLGHHRDDQIETTLLRASRGSGPDGLAGMSAIVEQADLRLLRPLLGIPAARLRATLRTLGQDWVEDPSNRDPRFARVRLRAALRDDPAADGAAAVESAQVRVATEAALANLLAASVAIHPEGWAEVTLQAWRTAPRAMAARALVRVLLAVGGAAYAPRRERLDQALDALLEDRLGRGRTLAGCRLLPHGQALAVAREAGRAAHAIPVADAGTYFWDERFVLTIAGAAAGRYRIAALSDQGWREVVAASPEIRSSPLPYAVRLTLPALFDLEGVVAVPHLMYGRQGADAVSVRIVSAMFRPRHALAGPGFAQS